MYRYFTSLSVSKSIEDISCEYVVFHFYLGVGFFLFSFLNQ